MSAGAGHDAVIVFDDVWKAFGANSVYEGMSLSVRRGETLTIIGGSGTGKSVGLKLLIGLMKADRGRILVDGVDVAALPERAMAGVRRKIGMLFQGAALFDSLTVRENVAYPLREHLRLGEDAIDARVARMLDLVGLPGTQDRMPADLSGGMKKRVGLARAIAVEPEVILYDEPTTGLDPANTRRINELIRAMQAKLSVTSIVVTHDMDSALTVSDRIAMLEDKRIRTVMTTGEVRASEDSRIRDFIEGRVER
jgi:phospholipid/cholesterol/gamma-HCH transport system ATP-binding protein